jgi:predicted  nucleic acid-binding Zn-ribbon protein
MSRFARSSAGSMVLLALATAACQGGGTGLAARIPSDSTEYYRTQAQQLTTISSQKDSLLTELSETTKLITDVSGELATIRTDTKNAPVVAGEGSRVDERAEVLNKVRALVSRVRQSEARLAAARRRVENLSGTNDSLRTALTAYANTITELQGVVESQKATIATLNEQVTALSGQVTTLSEEKRVLTDTVSIMTERENEIYYVVGTKKELMDRGVIQQEGGTRFLVFTRTGETLAPARVLDPQQFTRADKRTLSEIALPKPDKDYRIVSRHDLAYAEADQMNNGKFKGTLRITSPQQFWAPSKYLIIVEN